MKRRNLLGLLSVIPFAGPALSSTAEPADEWESDVCVIGAGLAGLTAAIAAKTAGAANVCVLEKESLLEGHSTISTGYFSAVRHMPGHDAEYRAAVDSMIADMEKNRKRAREPGVDPDSRREFRRGLRLDDKPRRHLAPGSV